MLILSRPEKTQFFIFLVYAIPPGDRASAAIAGEGSAIGWRHLTESLIRKRLRVPVLPQSWKTGKEFHPICSDRTELSESARLVRDWII